MNTEPTTEFSMLELVLDWLEPDPQRAYRFHPEGGRAIALGLQALLASGVPAKRPLQDVVRLATALKREYGATEIADQLLDLLLESEEALAVLGIAGRASRHELRRFAGERAPQAPHVEAKTPQGTVRVSSFLAPPRPLRPR